MTAVLHTRSDLAAALSGAPSDRVLVPTMGALHAGHEALIRTARSIVGGSGQVVVSIFVNPLQFNEAADLAAYPITPDADRELVARAGGDVIWAPTVADVYPPGEPVEPLDPGPLGAILEGVTRPGHFAGVLTVVRRLLMWASPGVAVFGEKDYQQLVLVRRMASGLDVPVTIHAVPTVRDADGLALSSRNGRLSRAGRVRALAIPRALAAGATVAGSAGEVVAAARNELQDLEVGYVECRAIDLGPAPAAGPARLLVAAVVDGVRLIDNAPVLLSEKS